MDVNRTFRDRNAWPAREMICAALTALDPGWATAKRGNGDLRCLMFKALFFLTLCAFAALREIFSVFVTVRLSSGRSLRDLSVL